MRKFLVNLTLNYYTIYRTTFVLALNDVENISFFENIVIVRVSYNRVHSVLHPHIQTVSWQGSAATFNIECLSHYLSTHFKPLCTNMYHIGLSDGAMLSYALRVKIYGATYIISDVLWYPTTIIWLWNFWFFDPSTSMFWFCTTLVSKQLRVTSVWETYTTCRCFKVVGI